MTFQDNKNKRITILDAEKGIRIKERYKLINIFDDVSYSKDARGLRVYCPVKLERIIDKVKSS